MSITLSWSVTTDGLPSSTVAALHAAVTEQINRFTHSVTADPVTIGAPTVDDTTVIDGWTRALAAEFLDRLRRDGGPTQAEVITAAAVAGGRIDRASVYAVAGWDPEARSLKGFTRPVNRIMHQMRTEGLLPEDAPRPIEPLYMEEKRGYQQAHGFEMPTGLIPLFTR